MLKNRSLYGERGGFIEIVALALVLLVLLTGGVFLLIISSEYRFVNDSDSEWRFMLLSGSHDAPLYMLKETTVLKPGEEMSRRHGADRFDCLMDENGTFYHVHHKPHDTETNIWKNTIRIYYRSQLQEGCAGSGRDLTKYRYLHNQYCSLIEKSRYPLCEKSL